MAYVTIEDRVDRLEALFGQFLTEMTLLNKRAEERHKAAEERFANFGTEMAEINTRADQRNQAAEDRMNRFKEEMAEINRRADQRNQAAEERNQAAEERMNRFHDEMAAFKKEMRQARKNLDKQWGDLANKMGTIIEDILAPNLQRLAREHFRFERIDDFMIRRLRRRPGQSKRAGKNENEFDTLVVGPDAVILGEAKSTPSLEYVEDFAGKVSTFFEFFPEYKDKRLIPVFGSWAIPDSLVEALTARRIYAMRMGEETMELANAAALETAPAA